MSGTTYSDAGVDIELGDRASAILYDAARRTWKNREGRLGEVAVPFDDFSGLRAVDLSGLPPDTMMCLGFDGVGTKAEIAERMDRHDTIAFDLFAMVCDDAVIRGGEPVVVGTVLDLNSLGAAGDDHLERIRGLAEGYVGAAHRAGVAVINGEMAELGGRVGGYGDFNYNWCAGLVWLARKERLITGREVRPGDRIVGLAEGGPRSNGLSLVRRVMEDAHGPQWHTVKHNAMTYGDLALEPSTIYCSAVVDMFGGMEGAPRARLHAAAHVTGGGLPGKLGRALKPSGMGAVIEEPFDPPALMLHCQDVGGVEDEEAYRTWNMGQGMVLVTPEPEAVVEAASEHGLEARVIGKVREEPGISIVSRGHFKQGEVLDFP